MKRNSVFSLLSFIFISIQVLAVPELEVSVLTCTPGDDLYAAYGHTAIRIHGMVGGQRRDYVYNYGTFEFDEGFIWKFTRGKLNYMLSRQEFRNFQYEYLMTNRGVEEQVLDLSQEQKMKLYQLLEENYKPENRYYLYDFFYDNCSTRVRDMLKKAFGEELVYGESALDSVTFRDLIHHYQAPWPWTSFGIDLALGLPCDKQVEGEEDMFLPDFLRDRLQDATLGNKPLVSEKRDLLLREENDVSTPMILPSVATWSVFVLFLLFTFIVKGVISYRFDSLLLFFMGLIGIFLVFLWFFTDHTATINNFNLLWAFPLHGLALIFHRQNVKYFQFLTLLGMGLLLFWVALPQALHPAVIPLILISTLIGVKRSLLKNKFTPISR